MGEEGFLTWPVWGCMWWQSPSLNEFLLPGRSHMHLLPYGGECRSDRMLSYYLDGAELKFYFPDHLPRTCFLSRKHDFAGHMNQIHQQFQTHLLHCFLMSWVLVFLGKHSTGSRNFSGLPLPLPLPKHPHSLSYLQIRAFFSKQTSYWPPTLSQPLSALQTPASPNSWCSFSLTREFRAR